MLPPPAPLTFLAGTLAGVSINLVTSEVTGTVKNGSMLAVTSALWLVAAGLLAVAAEISSTAAQRVLLLSSPSFSADELAEIAKGVQSSFSRRFWTWASGAFAFFAAALTCSYILALQ